MRIPTLFYVILIILLPCVVYMFINGVREAYGLYIWHTNSLMMTTCVVHSLTILVFIMLLLTLKLEVSTHHPSRRQNDYCYILA